MIECTVGAAVVQDVPDDKYPYVGVSPFGTIVLFSAPDLGVCLSEPDRDPEWNEEVFSVLSEPVTIQNKLEYA